MKPALTPQQELLTGEKQGALSLYKNLAVGEASWLSFLSYELSSFFFSNLTGLPGLALRSIFYPGMFQACGHRPAFGRGVVLRQPGKVTLGAKILIDDYSTLDVRGAGAITLGDYVSIGRYSTITAKAGTVHLESGVNVGTYCRIATQSRVFIGESTLIAAYAYIGPGNHRRGESETPLIAQEMEIKGGVTIGKHCWIGSGALIMDGVTIGDGAIIGAQSLVKDDVPAGAVVVGTPARKVSQ